jgi:hypothetical protein
MGRAEVVLDAEVQLETAFAEPRPAARGEHGGLVNLGHAEHTDEEGACHLFLTARHGELHVM